MRLIIRMMFIALLCACPSVSMAEKSIAMTLLPGIGIPVGGHWGGTYSTSFYLGAESEIRWTKNLATGGMAGYFYGHSDGNALKKEFKNLQLMPYVKYYRALGEKYTFYGVMGAGVYFVNYDDDAATPDIDDSTKRYFGYMTGLGISRKLAADFHLGIDCRLHQIFRQNFTITTLTPSLLARVDF